MCGGVAGGWGNTDRVIRKFIWQYKGQRLAKTILEKDKFVGLTLLDIKA